MIRFIYILLLFISSESFGQVTISHKSDAGPATVNATSYNSSSTLFTSGKLYIAVIYVTGATSDGVITATNTFTSVASVGDGTRRIQVFKSVASSTITEAINYNTFGSTGTGFLLSVYEVDGFITGDEIEDIVTQSSTTSANPSLTLSTHANAGVIAAFMNNTNPFSATTTYTEQIDNGYGTPTTGVYGAYSNNTTTGPTLTAASSTWLGVAVEIKARQRRIISSN